MKNPSCQDVASRILQEVMILCIILAGAWFIGYWIAWKCEPVGNHTSFGTLCTVVVFTVVYSAFDKPQRPYHLAIFLWTMILAWMQTIGTAR